MAVSLPSAVADPAGDRVLTFICTCDRLFTSGTRRGMSAQLAVHVRSQHALPAAAGWLERHLLWIASDDLEQLSAPSGDRS